MTLHSTVNSTLRRIIPDTVRTWGRKRSWLQWLRLPSENEIAALEYQEFGEHLLDLARGFLAARGRLNNELWLRISNDIRQGHQGNQYYVDVLTLFMPDYHSRLSDYYRLIQYTMLHRFLQYPFIGFLGSRVRAYQEAASKLGRLHVVDYGCGIPFGALHTLWKDPYDLASITLIDLDLIHLDFAEFAMCELAPEVPLKVHRLEDTDLLPEVDGHCNMVFAGDVFEHLVDPEKQLRALLRVVDLNPAMCYFDFCAHEDTYQHVTPDTSFLIPIVLEYGFEATESIGNYTGFVRGLPVSS